MSDEDCPRATVSTSATATVKVRPALLLMSMRVRATEATLELGLAESRKRGADAVRRLARLGAARAEAGEPHADEHANPDPMAKMIAERLPRRSAGATAERRGVNVTVTAVWELAGLSFDEVLLLVDRLRFDAAVDDAPPEPPRAAQPWAGPEEQLQAIMAQATAPPPEDRSPKFIYISRPDEGQLLRATAAAYETARRGADRLARATGHRLAGLASMNVTTTERADLLMERQRVAALLAASAYDLQDGEVATEDPRGSITVSIHASFRLDRPAAP